MPLRRLFTPRLMGGVKASQKKSLTSAPIRQARKTSIVNWNNLPHRMNNLEAMIVGHPAHLMKYPDALELPPRGKITKNHHLCHKTVLRLKPIKATIISLKALLHKNYSCLHRRTPNSLHRIMSNRRSLPKKKSNNQSKQFRNHHQRNLRNLK